MALFSLLMTIAASTAPQAADVEGARVCGPYQMQGTGMQISAVDRPVYSPDGAYEKLEKRVRGHFRLKRNVLPPFLAATGNRWRKQLKICSERLDNSFRPNPLRGSA